MVEIKKCTAPSSLKPRFIPTIIGDKYVNIKLLLFNIMSNTRVKTEKSEFFLEYIKYAYANCRNMQNMHFKIRSIKLAVV